VIGERLAWRARLKPRTPVRNLPDMASDDTKASGFSVSDRRSFSTTGEPRAAETQPEPAPAADKAPATGSTRAPELPPVDFHTFVLSLGSSALLALGEIESPDSGGPAKDLALAKHTIDILAMLEQKTRGNLKTDEEKLISSLLYDLRLRYVEANKAS